MTKSFDLNSHLNFEAKKSFVPYLNEFQQILGTVDFNEVYEGYKITFSKFEGKKDGLVYYEANSNVLGLPNTYKSLEDMCDFYNEWKEELIND